MPEYLRPVMNRGLAVGAIVKVVLLLATCGCTSLGQWYRNDCQVGPDYCKPAAPIELEWIDFGKDARVTTEAPALDAWWTVFNDATLNGLVETAYRQNLSVREAGTRILQARAIRNIAVGNMFPQEQEMLGGFTHSQNSREIAIPLPIQTFDNWDVGFNLSWELDFWGRFRRSIEAADAELEASVEEYDDVLVLLLSDVAANYVRVRTFQERLRFVHNNIAAQTGSYDIADARFKGGDTSNLDVDQAIINLRQTEALIPVLENGLRIANNRLCVLLGIPPRDLTKEWAPAPIPTAPAQLALGIPADLLRRRPDVRRAERLTAAQSARIGIAEAELYPRFALNGVISWEAEHFSNLFNIDRSLTGVAGTSFAWKILNYGRLRNGVRLEQARFEGLVYNYQQTVLLAQEEAENGIIGFLTSREQYQKLAESVVAANDAEDIVAVQYKAGAVDFNRVFVVQSTQAALQDQMAVAQGDIPLNLIAIYRALGGGWQIRLGTPEIPALPEGSPPPSANGEGSLPAPDPTMRPPAPSPFQLRDAPPLLPTEPEGAPNPGASGRNVLDGAMLGTIAEIL